MRFTTEKPKLQKGLSYVLKTSMLKNAVEATGLDLNIDLIYWNPYRIAIGETILECHYWLPNERIDYDRFYIRAGTVKSEHRKTAELRLKEKVIPEFTDWIIKVKSLPFDSTKLKHNLYFNAVFKDNDVSIFATSL
jgi:hypothetical protein